MSDNSYLNNVEIKEKLEEIKTKLQEILEAITIPE